MNRPSVLIYILLADLLLLLIGIFGPLWFGEDQLRMLSFTTAAIGIWTFLGFFYVLSEAGAAPQPLSELTRTIVSSFQTVVTVVIGFYFTSSAILEGIQRNRTGSIRDAGGDKNTYQS